MSDEKILGAGSIVYTSGDPDDTVILGAPNLDVGSVVDFKSDDGSINQKNCIVIRKRTLSNGKLEFVVYDADDHIAYIGSLDNLKTKGKSVDITSILDNIETLLKDIDTYEDDSKVEEDKPDESGIIVDGTVVSLSGVTVTKSGDSVDTDHSYNSAVYVLNSGTLSLDQSTITTKGKYSDGVLVTTKSNTTLTNSTVTTQNTDSDGIVLSGGAIVSSTKNTVTVNGDNSEAIEIGAASKLTITGGSYTSNKSTGMTMMNNTIVTATDASIKGTTGIDTNVSEAATITLEGTTVTATSGNTVNLKSAGKIIFNDKNGTLSETSANGILINNSGVTSTVNLDNTTLNMTNSEKTIAKSTGNGDLTINAVNQTLNGNFIVDTGSVLTINLDNSNLDGRLTNNQNKNITKLTLKNKSTFKLEEDTYVQSIDVSDDSKVNLNGHTLYVFDNDLQKYIEYEDPHDRHEAEYHEEDHISVRTLKVIPEKNLPLLADRDKNTVYFVYDKMNIYVYRSKFNDPFSIVNQLPDKSVLVNNMIYILSEDPKDTSGTSAEQTAVTDDDSNFTMRAGDVIAYVDYRKKLVARLDTSASDYQNSLNILKAANTVTLLNAEARYIDKQTRRLNLPYQNGKYQLSLNLDDDIEINNNTVIFFNKNTEQFEIDGDRSIEDLRLRNPNLYKGLSTASTETTVDVKNIRTDVKISDDPDNGLVIRGDGLFVDTSNYAKSSDYEDITRSFITYKDVMDSYATEIADAVTKVVGSVSQEAIDKEIDDTLKDYSPTIFDVLSKYDAVKQEADRIYTEATSGTDSKIEIAKQQIIDYINQQEDPWERIYNYDQPLPEAQYRAQSIILDETRDEFLNLRPGNYTTIKVVTSTTNIPATPENNTVYYLYNESNNSFAKYSYIDSKWVVDKTTQYATVTDNTKIVRAKASSQSTLTPNIKTADNGSYSSYGVTQLEQNVQDYIIDEYNDIVKHVNNYEYADTRDQLPATGKEGKFYIVNNTKNTEFYVYDSKDNLYHKYHYTGYSMVPTGDTMSSNRSTIVYQIFTYSDTMKSYVSSADYSV